MNALTLDLQGTEAFDDLPTRRTLRRWIVSTLQRDAELTLRFVGSREGRKLNRDYRGKDYATNVLTFDYTQRPVVHADIVICVPVLRREAVVQRKSLRAHLAHLVIHGCLHAQGYDHERDADAQKMERREIELLAAFRIDNPYAKTSHRDKP
jgi:probable rRNA maturation factor